ncbi:hypothetical protein FB451DRAFT_1251649 [Mycena latifolia]|nr:hypothetical protein FB451DRAFT_1251649 [Mycena latifolia]
MCHLVRVIHSHHSIKNSALPYTMASPGATPAESAQWLNMTLSDFWNSDSNLAERDQQVEEREPEAPAPQADALERKRARARAAQRRYYEKHPEIKEKKRLAIAAARLEKKLRRRQWDPPKKPKGQVQPVEDAPPEGLIDLVAMPVDEGPLNPPADVPSTSAHAPNLTRSHPHARTSARAPAAAAVNAADEQPQPQNSRKRSRNKRQLPADKDEQHESDAEYDRWLEAKLADEERQDDDYEPKPKPKQEDKTLQKKKHKTLQKKERKTLQQKRESRKATVARYYQKHPEVREKSRLRMAAMRLEKKLRRRRWDPPKKKQVEPGEDVVPDDPGLERVSVPVDKRRQKAPSSAPTARKYTRTTRTAARARMRDQQLGDFSAHLDLDLDGGLGAVPTHDELLELFIAEMRMGMEGHGGEESGGEAEGEEEEEALLEREVEPWWGAESTGEPPSPTVCTPSPPPSARSESPPPRLQPARWDLDLDGGAVPLASGAAREWVGTQVPAAPAAPTTGCAPSTAPHSEPEPEPHMRLDSDSREAASGRTWTETGAPLSSVPPRMRRLQWAATHAVGGGEG